MPQDQLLLDIEATSEPGLGVAISPRGRPLALEFEGGGQGLSAQAAKRLEKAFDESLAAGLLSLATFELQTALPPDWTFLRDFARLYLTRLCQTPDLDDEKFTGSPAPKPGELAELIQSAPPLRGGEYLSESSLVEWWNELDSLIVEEARRSKAGLSAYLREKNPLWRTVGRVTFHLAENKRDPSRPFAFLATYSDKLTTKGSPSHNPLGQAVRKYLDAKDRSTLLNLLAPVQKAAEKSALVKEMVDSNEIYHPQLWTPAEALRFLRDIPVFEASGVLTRVPDWWNSKRPPRPMVSLRVGDRMDSGVGVDAMLDFSISVALEGDSLTAKELRELMATTEGLVWLKGKWVEVDRDKLSEALAHWKSVEKATQSGEMSFFEGMRLLSGMPSAAGASQAASAETEWSGVTAGKALAATLAEWNASREAENANPPGLQGVLRPYQREGFGWLKFVTRLGLGACLADDMGLGKTIQVLSLLLDVKQRDAQVGSWAEAQRATERAPSLLVAPASLLANWKSEMTRFAPSLVPLVAHPSENPELTDAKDGSAIAAAIGKADLVLTTYGMLTRLEGLRRTQWNLLILDEAQAIKNSGAKQTRAVKEVRSRARIAMTGTPIENRLGDLWSLFDFLNPGLLGGAKSFGDHVKRLSQAEGNRYGPLRKLIQPYILRRLKTDKSVIDDLPEKIETNSYCHLTKIQAALYERATRALRDELENVSQQRRRGIVLAYLMKFKQICNHPAQGAGETEFDPEKSGKFIRLAEILGELAERQQKVLVFTQFREITAPLAAHLATVFERPGLVLTGETTVGKRREMVEKFQRDDGPPFFVLSLKAGGVGLNLTAASHVVHFDRWWNPAVENQATDRAFRIGQRQNVFVHKFVCRGTIEERIDELISSKRALAKDLVEGGAEPSLTEMNDDQLLSFVALDIHKALAT